MSEKTDVKVHWSFWGICAAGLVYNLMGCMNFISQMNAETVASMPDMYRAIVEARPTWVTGAFAIAVFGGALGSLLLLLKKSIAVYVFIAALIGTVVAQITFVGMEDFPDAAWVGWISQLVVGGFLIWYSKWTQNKGWIS